MLEIILHCLQTEEKAPRYTAALRSAFGLHATIIRCLIFALPPIETIFYAKVYAYFHYTALISSMCLILIIMVISLLPSN